MRRSLLWFGRTGAIVDRAQSAVNPGALDFGRFSSSTVRTRPAPPCVVQLVASTIVERGLPAVHAAPPAARERVLARVPPAAIIVVLFSLLVLPAIFYQHAGSTGGKDQERYHLPTVAIFASEVPDVDLNDARTATAPAYHVVLAGVYRYVSSDRLVLQLVSTVLSLALILVLYRQCARRVDRWLALLFTFPLLFSNYFLQSAVWIETDNAALLFVVLALGGVLAVASGRRTARVLVAAGLFAAIAVSIRQIHLWLMAPIILSALIATGLVPRLRVRSRPHLTPLAWGALGALVPLAVFVGLVLEWNGLTPPRFQEINASAISPAVVPFGLGLLGFFGTFFAVAVGARLREIAEAPKARIAAVAGGATALIVTTSSSYAHGRAGGGLWKLVDRAPVVANRSLLLAVMAAWGAAVLLWWWRAAIRAGVSAQCAVVLTAFTAWLAAQGATNYVYQRYFEPMLLLVLALAAALVAGKLTPPSRGRQVMAGRRSLVAMLGLTAIQFAGCVIVVYAATLHAPHLP
jgi:hypothetical protein